MNKNPRKTYEKAEIKENKTITKIPALLINLLIILLNQFGACFVILVAASSFLFYYFQHVLTHKQIPHAGERKQNDRRKLSFYKSKLGQVKEKVYWGGDQISLIWSSF